MPKNYSSYWPKQNKNMDYKAYPDGTYIATFRAQDLIAIVRMVKQNELRRKEEQDALLQKVEEAEKEARSSSRLTTSVEYDPT